MKSSKKLVPRLFGVNKESIVRVDERTKEVLQVMLYTNFTNCSAAALMIYGSCSSSFTTWLMWEVCSPLYCIWDANDIA